MTDTAPRCRGRKQFNMMNFLIEPSVNCTDVDGIVSEWAITMKCNENDAFLLIDAMRENKFWHVVEYSLRHSALTFSTFHHTNQPSKILHKALIETILQLNKSWDEIKPEPIADGQ
jgi:hypothetical protein